MSNNKKAFVLGMARSGYEAAKLLASKGYEVIVNDAKDEQNSEQIHELQSIGVKIVTGSHPDNLFDNTFEMIVKNPGISNDHEYIKKAIKLNIPVINEMELAFKYFCKGITIIGVTGTNGKTTTTTLIYEFLKNAFKSAFLMGNIGYPACSFVSKLKDGDIAVMEVSDHQLCNVIDFKTNISVLTNLSEAHLDFHGTYENYKLMKKKIFNHHTELDIAIINLDDENVIELTNDIESTKKYFSFNSCNKLGCSIIDGYICYNNNKIIDLDEVKIKGKHNYENIMAAIAVAKEFDVDNDVIVRVLKVFGGVEHRLEYVKTIKNIDFYNDSKATNIKSTQTALASFAKPTILLLGGLDRGQSFIELKEFLKNVKLIVAYGEVKIRINDFAMECDISCEVVDNLEEATKIAYNFAKEGDVILLSPACASWDQFKDFEIRGNMFKEYINNL
ncbi:UDP-N-acetylmuramoyl-L-alanine--D-glutamate ligase [Clostridium sp. C2-6-12]|uniref:UDP-N-acetylmuramoyl-L-alanine--D-glutamate ligase n=1 Tax=Clostridium sp. C2-6-12 TaxID=2698832 RepID=UPI00136DB380|nr:UDP-N-acetylmuramoyl-L-alanine--D-glutamate ligase [Clostridium sp. C2-6-12]